MEGVTIERILAEAAALTDKINAQVSKQVSKKKIVADKQQEQTKDK